MHLHAIAKDVVGTSTVPDAFFRPFRSAARAPRLAAVALLCALSVGPAAATVQDQAQLPVQAEFGCMACHSGPSTTAHSVQTGEATQLNSFGRDWLLRGRVWSALLAFENSDGDGCSNGYELGDPNGSWKRNPGIPGDCLLPIGERSFGILKGLFRDE
jgi:hypothetical protein